MTREPRRFDSYTVHKLVNTSRVLASQGKAVSGGRVTAPS